MQYGWIEKEEVEFPVLCPLVVREFTEQIVTDYIPLFFFIGVLYTTVGQNM